MKREPFGLDVEGKTAPEPEAREILHAGEQPAEGASHARKSWSARCFLNEYGPAMR